MKIPRWANFFAETEPHEWRLRLAQCLFVMAVSSALTIWLTD